MENETEISNPEPIGTEPVASFEMPKENEEDPYKRDKKGRLLPGTKGGPGRPKGKSLKEYWKQKLSEMTDEEKENFSSEITQEIKWRMAEGNPTSDTNHGGVVKIIIANESDENEMDNGTT
jgi:hypothetical protein